jgi:LDH2 family malate/lactate/ureidoglycolate dehydrogenase
MEGSLLAFGGHKGAGLAIVVGALAGVFSGAKYGAQIPAPTDYSTERDIGHFLLLIDTSFLGDADENMARMRTYLADITASGEGVRYPGQRSGSSRRRALDEGVTLPTTVLERLRQEASDAGHDLELPGALT